MVDATGIGVFKGQLSIWACAAICREGAYHPPHSYPDSAWPGVYHVNAGRSNPNRPLSEVLEFLDPHVGVGVVSTPGDPYSPPRATFGSKSANAWNKVTAAVDKLKHQLPAVQWLSLQNSN
jgi:hypothetical protein